MKNLVLAGLITENREKVPDKYMVRGWDWMKVLRPITGGIQMSLIVANLRRFRSYKYHERECSICGTKKEPLIPVFHGSAVALYCEKHLPSNSKKNMEEFK